MNAKTIPLAAALAPLIFTGCGGETSGTGKVVSAIEQDKGYVVLDESLSRLIQDFNANKGKVRLLFIVGDTCGICLRGMADLNDAFLARAQADDRLLTFVVHVPTLGAEERHVPEAMQLLHGPRIVHYWDRSGMSGMQLVETLDTNGIYAWDVWLAYGPESMWAGDVPPPPEFWMHQLPSLARTLRLDAGRFGEQTAALMQEVSIGDLVESPAGEAGLLADGTVISSVAQPAGRAIVTHIRGRGGYQNLKAVQSIFRYGQFGSNAGGTPIRVVYDRESGLSREYEDPAIGLPADLETKLADSWEFDGMLVDWKEKGHQVRLSGMRKIGPSLDWKLFLLQSNGARWALYVDSHTGDTVLQERLDDHGQVMFSIAAGEFTDFDGIRLPDTIEYRNSQGEPIANERYTNTRIAQKKDFK